MVEVGKEPSISFLGSVILVPIFFLGLVSLNKNPSTLLYIHILSGIIWFGMAIIVPAVLILYLGFIDPTTVNQFIRKTIPKIVLFMLAVSFMTVLSGSLLADQFGLLHADSPWMLRVFVLGWILWLFGLFVSNRMHLTVYFEGKAPNPDLTLLKSIEKKILVAGIFEALIMLGIIYLVLNPGFRLWNLF
ncbi:hypothetical protein ZOD2009_09645 [Haladaptatus paucihalophilus DX253]|nr:hypothetical protein ZOD2009_09645 [Haladaptatus paucihalophilus DX253]